MHILKGDLFLIKMWQAESKFFTIIRSNVSFVLNLLLNESRLMDSLMLFVRFSWSFIPLNSLSFSARLLGHSLANSETCYF